MTLQSIDDCPFSENEIETLNFHFEKTSMLLKNLEDEQYSNYTYLENKGLFSNLGYKAATLKLITSSSIGREYYKLLREVDDQEGEFELVTLSEEWKDVLREEDYKMQVKEQETVKKSHSLLDYFEEIKGYESIVKLEWILKYCPEGYFRYTVRNAIEHHNKSVK